MDALFAFGAPWAVRHRVDTPTWPVGDCPLFIPISARQQTRFRPSPESVGRLIGMSAPSISRYPVPKLDDLPEDVRARMLEVQDKAGFIPNVFLKLAHR